MSPQRRDLSPYVLHLTRDYEDTFAPDNLVSILESKRIEARTPLGVAVKHLEQIGCEASGFMDCQQVACFSETPLDSLHGLIDPGVWRRNHFRAYGVAFTRETMLDYGANPVWYLNTFPSRRAFEWLVRSVNDLIDDAAQDRKKQPDVLTWRGSRIANLTPFIETIGEWGEKKKDFSFEREWRYRGDFEFEYRDVAAVIVPPGETPHFKRALIAEGVARYVVRQFKFVELEEPKITRD